MGKISGTMANLSIITSDDPGYEDPVSICEEVNKYVVDAGGTAIMIPDRAEAINYALSILEDGDILVLLGKGHETYQKVNGQKIYFSEKECIEKYYAKQS